VSEKSRPPLTTTTSIWPAAAVLILAVLTLLIFMAINLISDQGVTTTTTTVPIVVGGLTTDRSSVVLSGCHQPDNPPTNIVGAFLVPTHTRANGPAVTPNSGAGDFDCYRHLVTTASAAELLGYYSAHLQARGWNLFSRGTSNGSPQLLFQKAGSDGFYWIVGISVNATHGSTARWTYRIYQNSETI
jgi:hypothetical protein